MRDMSQVNSVPVVASGPVDVVRVHCCSCGRLVNLPNIDQPSTDPKSADWQCPKCGNPTIELFELSGAWDAEEYLDPSKSENIFLRPVSRSLPHDTKRP